MESDHLESSHARFVYIGPLGEARLVIFCVMFLIQLFLGKFLPVKLLSESLAEIGPEDCALPLTFGKDGKDESEGRDGMLIVSDKLCLASELSIF